MVGRKKPAKSKLHPATSPASSVTSFISFFGRQTVKLSTTPKKHLYNHFRVSIAMINEDDHHLQRSSPEPSLKQRKPITTTDNITVSVENATAATASSIVENLYKEGDLDPVYHAKTLVLNRALQEIGMVKYQVKKLITCIMYNGFC